MYDITVCNSRGEFQSELDPGEISQIRDNPNRTLWLDLVQPKPEDFKLLQEEFGLHPLAIEDASRPNHRPKVDTYDGYYFAVFYAVQFDEQRTNITTVPLYIFIGRNYLITIHPAPVRQIQETLKRWRDPNSPLGQDMGALVHALLDSIVDDYFPVIDQVADRIEAMEEQIFNQYDETALQSIFNLKKDLLAVRRVVAPERDVLNILLRREIPVFDEQDVPYLQDVYDHIVRIIDSLDTYRDLLSSALDTFLSVQSNRLNQVVKALTITSIVLMSVAIVSGIYGMNFDYMPELHWRFGYLWALSLMASLAGGLIWWFRRIKWL